jgi:hypothetical protein
MGEKSPLCLLFFDVLVEFLVSGEGVQAKESRFFRALRDF